MTVPYEPVPTGAKFHADDHFVRGLMGNFSSGKSVACCWEIFFRCFAQNKQSDGFRHSRWVVVRNCYDDETEILSDHGWKLFKDLTKEDQVAQLNDSKMEFVTPTYHYSADYVGEMIGFENEGVNFKVTPDHKLSVSLRNARKNEWSDYRLRKATDVYGKQNMRVKRDAEWDGIDPGVSEEFFEWLGYWFAEGSTTVKSYNGSLRHNCIITSKNDVEYAEQTFRLAGLPFTTNYSGDVARIRLSVTPETKPLILKLAECGKATTKRVPSEWKNAPPGHLRAFIAGHLQGDGSHRQNDSTICSGTSSKQLADDLQEMGLRAGYVVNARSDPAVESMVINGVQTRQNADHHTLTFMGVAKHHPILIAQGTKKHYRGWYKETYSGKVLD